MFVLHFCYQVNYNFYGTSTSKYSSGFYTLYFSNQLSKCVTSLSRTFIKYFEYYISFYFFPWRNYFLQTFEEDQSSTENTEKIFNWKIATFLFITEEANNFEEKKKKKRRNTKSREIESENNPNTFQVYRVTKTQEKKKANKNRS